MVVRYARVAPKSSLTRRNWLSEIKMSISDIDQQPSWAVTTFHRNNRGRKKFQDERAKFLESLEITLRNTSAHESRRKSTCLKSVDIFKYVIHHRKPALLKTSLDWIHDTFHRKSPANSEAFCSSHLKVKSGCGKRSRFLSRLFNFGAVSSHTDIISTISDRSHSIREKVAVYQ